MECRWLKDFNPSHRRWNGKSCGVRLLTWKLLFCACPSQADSNGRIVIISSIMGHGVLMPGAIPYAMSKAAISHMSQSMARELTPHRINVNAVLPGFTDTPGALLRCV